MLVWHRRHSEPSSMPAASDIRTLSDYDELRPSKNALVLKCDSCGPD